MSAAFARAYSDLDPANGDWIHLLLAEEGSCQTCEDTGQNFCLARGKICPPRDVCRQEQDRYICDQK